MLGGLWNGVDSNRTRCRTLRAHGASTPRRLCGVCGNYLLVPGFRSPLSVFQKRTRAVVARRHVQVHDSEATQSRQCPGTHAIGRSIQRFGAHAAHWVRKSSGTVRMSGLRAGGRSIARCGVADLAFGRGVCCPLVVGWLWFADLAGLGAALLRLSNRGDVINLKVSRG
jgi:hypothetical protein